MENASKALLIAGGILITIIILTLFLMMYSRLASIKKIQQEEAQNNNLAAFNAEYEAYNKKVMYGTDVITLINKVIENNKKYSGNNDYLISIKLNGYFDTTSNIMTLQTQVNNLLRTTTEQEEDGIYSYIFECVKMGYNQLGRINLIEIKLH